MPLLFSYGTLQQEAVQLSTFGRLLQGQPDELVGFEQSVRTIEDPQFVATSGMADHFIVTFNGASDSRVKGTVFEVSYETTFCATHRLTRDGQAIEPLHGHDWRVEVVAAGDDLDAIGVVLDFEHLKKAVGDVAAGFHYRDMNAQGGLGGASPSAEVVARHFFQEVRKGLGAEGRLLRRVRVWEAPGCSATYAE